jgi:hypothetical protein
MCSVELVSLRDFRGYCGVDTFLDVVLYDMSVAANTQRNGQYIPLKTLSLDVTF